MFILKKVTTHKYIHNKRRRTVKYLITLISIRISEMMNYHYYVLINSDVRLFWASYSHCILNTDLLYISVICGNILEILNRQIYLTQNVAFSSYIVHVRGYLESINSFKLIHHCDIAFGLFHWTWLSLANPGLEVAIIAQPDTFN